MPFKFVQFGKRILMMVLFGFVASCASFRHNDTEIMDETPFYKNYEKDLSIDKTSVYFVPVSVDPITQKVKYFENHQAALEKAATLFTAYLDSLDFKPFSHELLFNSDAPLLYAGSKYGQGSPVNATIEEREEDKDEYQDMVLYLSKAPKKWQEKYQPVAPDGFTLIVQIGIAEYPIARKGLFGKKLMLGTNYEKPVDFLNAVDSGAEVFHVMGMVLDKNGDVLRTAAEGILYQKTPFWAQIFDIKRSIDTNAIRAMLAKERREDLRGNPLAWHVAMENLLWLLLENE